MCFDVCFFGILTKDLSQTVESLWFASFPRLNLTVGSITTRCSGKEPALFRRKGRVDQTPECGGA